MKLLDQFMPFLMLYKFFLPVLNLIICIIEVLCSISNPFKLIKSISRLFRNCIPEFLNMFPYFALIIMIISLLLLLLALVEYITQQILKMIKVILRNINALQKSFKDGDANSVQAIAKKLGSVLCIFQNLFVLLDIFSIIITIFKDMLSLVFAIPPCEDTDPSNADGCCTPDVCPTIVKSNYTNKTGTFQYFNRVAFDPAIPGFSFSVDARSESWQLYDVDQTQAQQFRNIFDAFDIPFTPKPIFFPTDVSYNATTAPKQAAYTLDLRLFYNPSNWGRLGTSRFIRFKNCIMTATPTTGLKLFDNSISTVNNGVAILAGGAGYEDDDTTILTGFDIDGATPISAQATLENFLHQPATISIAPISPTLAPTDGYAFSNMEYTFKPNIEILLGKNLITLGCVPDVALNRTFVNNVITGDLALKIAQLKDLPLPDPAAAQQCLLTAVAALRSDLTTTGVAQFQATTTICLKKLSDDTSAAINDLIGIGFDPCRSDFTVAPTPQFTSKSIGVKVNLKEKTGLSLTTGISPSIGATLAARLKAHISFGEISKFVYDGYQFFTADINSKLPGKGTISVSFDNNIFCKNNIPADTTVTPTHDLQVLDYQFIYTPGGVPVAERDSSDGSPARDNSDLSGESFGGKDGS